MISSVRRGSVTWLVLICASTGAPAASGPASEPAPPQTHRVAGQLRLEFDERSGRATVYDPAGKPLLVNASAAAVSSGETLLPGQARFTRSSRVVDSDEPLLPGRCLHVTCRDTQEKLDLDWRVTLLSDRPGAVFELVMTNASPQDLPISHCEPLRLIASEGAGCRFGACGEGSRVRKALTHGRMYYDPGQLLDFTPDGPGELHSYCTISFAAPGAGPAGLAAGYLENRDAEGTFTAGWIPGPLRRKRHNHHEPAGEPGNDLARQDEPDRETFNLTARSRYGESFVLHPGARRSSGRVLVLLDDEPLRALETYAELSGRLHRARLNPIINGWCSWFVTYGDVSEQEVLKHAEFIARELKPWGMEWVQIDDGYQTAFGDWEGNAKFPHGMKWLAGRIRELGLRPGLWIAPYAISANTDLARRHPDWLVHAPDGQLQPIVREHQGQAQYILDITHPQARKWLSDLFRTITKEWGYDFIKTDFVEWTILAAGRYHDPAVSKAQAYRMGCEIMRQAMGPERHLLDCGPAPMAVGLIDSMRIQLDRPSPPCTVWEHYSGWYNSVIPAVAKRSYFHNRTWINDPDHLRTGELTIAQARAAASIIALAGGTVLSGDRLYALDPARLDILRKVLPACGQGARPLDLFEKPLAESFALQVSRPWGSWQVVGLFNGGADAVERELKFSRLGLPSGQTYLVYGFWSQQLLAEATERVRLRIEPTSVALLAIRERQGVPQVLSTDRHVLQGAVELGDVRWDAAENALSGTALGAPGTSWGLTIYVPQGYTLGERDPAGHLTDLQLQGRLLRARIGFDQTGRTAWSVRFSR